MAQPVADHARIVLACIKDNPGLSLREIINRLGIDHNEVFAALSELEEKSLVVSHHDHIDYSTIVVTYYSSDYDLWMLRRAKI